MAKKKKNPFVVDLNSGDRTDGEVKGKPGIDQIEAYINKVRFEITQGEIPVKAGQDLINKATHLIQWLKA